MNKPKTIADLDINWTFTIEYRNFIYWELDFLHKNPTIKNYKIKQENYIFQIRIRDQLYKFEIWTHSNTYLFNLIFSIHEKISYIYRTNFSIEGACFRLIRFKETVFSNVFVIEVEEI